MVMGSLHFKDGKYKGPRLRCINLHPDRATKVQITQPMTCYFTVLTTNLRTTRVATEKEPFRSGGHADNPTSV